jgi:lipopolysaccharide transport system permease protein
VKNNGLFLFAELVRRNLSSRFAGTYGGRWWAVLNPLLLCALYAFVFAVVLRLSPPAGFPGTYGEFLLAGLLPWLGLQDAVTRAATSITDSAHLVRKLPFPAELLVGSSVVAGLILQAAGVALLVLYEAAVRRIVPNVPLLLLAFAFELLLLAGPALALAAVNVFFRDLSQLLPPVLTITLYVTPIFYDESLVPGPMRQALVLNPVRDLVGLFRFATAGGAPPDWTRVLAWSAAGAAAAVLGARFFRRSRPVFSDLL